MMEVDDLAKKVEFALREYGYQPGSGPGSASLQVAMTMLQSDALVVARRHGEELNLSKAVRMAEEQAARRS